jgi:hypothetical protein
MTLEEMIQRPRGPDTALAARQQEQDALMALRSDDSLTEDAVTARVATRDAADAEVTRRQGALDELLAEQAREAETRRAGRAHRADRQPGPGLRPGGRVGQEERTYRADQDRRGSAFEGDVIGAFMGDYEAQERIRRHMQEERVERGQYLTRAVGTTAFAGLTVPQYLTDLYAPNAAARRPFADAIAAGPGGHELPASGMTVNLSQITTASSTAVQASQNAAVSETNMDDTLLTINVQTNAGQQTVSRQAIERGTGVEPIVLDELFRRYGDHPGLHAADAGHQRPDERGDVHRLHRRQPDRGRAVPEAAPGHRGRGDLPARPERPATTSRSCTRAGGTGSRTQVGSTWPFVGQPGFSSPMATAPNFGVAYGRGVRGVLPNGTPVIVDNNIATNSARAPTRTRSTSATVASSTCGRTPTPRCSSGRSSPALASLGVLLVVYGYFAYTHVRYAHAQKIAAPAW